MLKIGDFYIETVCIATEELLISIDISCPFPSISIFTIGYMVVGNTSLTAFLIPALSHNPSNLRLYSEINKYPLVLFPVFGTPRLLPRRIQTSMFHCTVWVHSPAHYT